MSEFKFSVHTGGGGGGDGDRDRLQAGRHSDSADLVSAIVTFDDLWR